MKIIIKIRGGKIISIGTQELLKNKTKTERLFDLFEKVILWTIRTKCSMTLVANVLMTTGGATFASPPLIIELLKLYKKANPYIVKIENYDFIPLIIGGILFSVGGIIHVLNYFGFFRNFLLDKKVVIKQYSMGPPTFNAISELKNNYKLIEFDIVLTKFWKDRKIELKNVSKAIKYQDKLAKNILFLKKNIQDFSFFSIASLPFVARLAAQLGNEQSYSFYENDQSGSTGFHKLEDASFLTNLNVIENEIKDSNELIVSIGITKPIERNVIPNHLKDCNYIYIEHETAHKLPANIDVIKSSRQLMEYRDFIKSEIIKLQGIKTIHVFYSGQTSLMYSLISSFSENYENYKIIVYHYYQGEYPWGIDIYEINSKKALVVTSKK